MTQHAEVPHGALADKVAVITGATSGMGLATATLFAREGAHVYITGRRKDRLDDAVHAIEGIAAGSVTGVQPTPASLTTSTASSTSSALATVGSTCSTPARGSARSASRSRR